MFCCVSVLLWHYQTGKIEKKNVRPVPILLISAAEKKKGSERAILATSFSFLFFKIYYYRPYRTGRYDYSVGGSPRFRVQLVERVSQCKYVYVRVCRKQLKFALGGGFFFLFSFIDLMCALSDADRSKQE